MSAGKTKLKFRSQNWFDNPDNADMTALYLERYLNYGFTRGELQGGRELRCRAEIGAELVATGNNWLRAQPGVRRVDGW